MVKVFFARMVTFASICNSLVVGGSNQFANAGEDSSKVHPLLFCDHTRKYQKVIRGQGELFAIKRKSENCVIWEPSSEPIWNIPHETTPKPCGNICLQEFTNAPLLQYTAISDEAYAMPCHMRIL